MRDALQTGETQSGLASKRVSRCTISFDTQ